MLKLLVVGMGGFIGAIARYTITDYVQRATEGRFPYGTLIVNIVGCFLIGLFMHLMQTREYFGPHARLHLSIGLLGSLTTFSTFAWDTFDLIANERFAAASMNITAQVLVGMAAVWLAIQFGRAVFGQ